MKNKISIYNKLDNVHFFPPICSISHDILTGVNGIIAKTFHTLYKKNERRRREIKSVAFFILMIENSLKLGPQMATISYTKLNFFFVFQGMAILKFC